MLKGAVFGLGVRFFSPSCLFLNSYFLSIIGKYLSFNFSLKKVP